MQPAATTWTSLGDAKQEVIANEAIQQEPLEFPGHHGMLPPAGVDGRIRRVAVALVLFFWALLLVATGGFLWNSRQQALLEGQEQLQRSFSSAETALNRTLLSIDVLLNGLSDLPSVTRSVDDADTADALPDTMAVTLHTMHQWLRTAARQNLVARSVLILDAQHRVVAASEQNDLDVARRWPEAWLEQAWSQGAAATVVSPPQGVAASDDLVLYFARVVSQAKGERWLAIVEVPIESLNGQLRQGQAPQGLQITLESQDGNLLTSLDTSAASFLGLQPEGQNLEQLQQGAGSWEQMTRISGEPGKLITRSLFHPQLWLSASLSQKSVLLSWYSQRNVVVVSALVLGLFGLMVAWLCVQFARKMMGAQQALLESKQTLVQALESMVTGFVLLDAQGRVLNWNSRFLTLFPWVLGCIRPNISFRQILEQAATAQLPKADPLEREQWVQRRLGMQQGLLHGLDGPHEQWLPTGRCVQITERMLPEGGLVIVYHDVTELRQASAEIENLAYYDALTGLPNRRTLLDRIDLVARRLPVEGHSAAILFLDLDQFKKLNDTQGHELGDALLCVVSERLKQNVRSSDTVARLGGDEFVILLAHLAGDSEAASEEVRRIGNALLDVLSQPYELGALVHYGSCSMGVSLFRDGSLSGAELLRQADIAMYEVKGQRGNGLRFYDPQMQANLRHRAEMEGDLQLALEREEFVLFYQPQFTLTGQLVGAEALLRWQHPVRGMVSPGAFIPVAEESELILGLGRWVLRAACAQLVQWQKDPLLSRLHLSINVSARQFHQPDFIQEVVGIVQKTGIRPHLLKIELTESLVLENVDETIATMHALRTKGIRFAVDDFGTGYSSLAYLSRLPLNELKIDQSFVRNIGEHYNDDVIVQTIIGMARNLDLEVVAEGVETIAQRDYLARHGCDTYQGYLFGRPVPVEDFEAMVRQPSPRAF